MVPAHLGYGLGLFLHFADDAVLVRDRQTGETVARALDTAVSLDLLASLGLFDFAELGVHLPVRLVYRGGVVGVGGAALAAAAGVGDVRLVPKLQLFRSGGEARGFVLGVAAPVTLPTGQESALRGAGVVTVEPRLLALAYGERWFLAGSVGFRVRGRTRLVRPRERADVRASATYAPLVEGDWLDLQLEALGGWIPGLRRAVGGQPAPRGAGRSDRAVRRCAGRSTRAAGAGLTNGVATPGLPGDRGRALHGRAADARRPEGQRRRRHHRPGRPLPRGSRGPRRLSGQRRLPRDRQRPRRRPG